MKLTDDNKKYALIAGLIAFGVLLFAILMNFGSVLGVLQTLVQFFLPLIAGLIIAFILDVPVRGIQKLLGRCFAKEGKDGWIRKAAVVLTLLILIGVIVLIAVIINPVIVESVLSAKVMILSKLPELTGIFGLEEIPVINVMDFLKNIFANGITDAVSLDFGQIAAAVVDKTSDTISFMITVGLGIIISVYVLFDKERVLRHSDKLLTAVVPQRGADYIRKICKMLNNTYSSFLSGQCIEALILGIFMFIVLIVFKIPYAALIAMLAAVLSFVPYLGPFIALAIGVLLTFIAAPGKVILLVILYLAVQIVEEQLIYPHVVGGSVGLSPLLTLLAVIIGGNIFGLLGVLFFIPLMSVLYELVKEWADKRIKKSKGM